jgi:hypothetical protein
MQLIKFEAYYGGFYSDNTYEVLLENGSVFYYENRFSRETDPVRIEIDIDKLAKFLKALKSITERWRKYYFTGICDGTQWSIEIVTDDIKIDFGGSNAYPHNFVDFLRVFRRFIGYPQYARGHHKDEYLTWGELPPLGSDPYKTVSRYNLRTKRHLRKQTKTIRQLADYLQMDYNFVCHQLRCIDTFQIEDLLKIAQFLGVSVTEFLYESDHDLPRRRTAAVEIGADFNWTPYDELRANMAAGIRLEKLKELGLISNN